MEVQSAFSTFSTNDADAAREFYGGKLGLNVRESEMGALDLVFGPDHYVTIYVKANHVPATFTILNLIVPNIDEAVDELTGMGIPMEHYDIPGMNQDAKGVVRDRGGAAAWFKDPAGNIVAVLTDE
jgi:catechol 2,3-dioxygenase-like lactoylglutathione lyase family enzyme